MRAVRIVALAPAFHDDPRLLQRISNFSLSLTWNDTMLTPNLTFERRVLARGFRSQTVTLRSSAPCGLAGSDGTGNGDDVGTLPPTRTPLQENRSGPYTGWFKAATQAMLNATIASIFFEAFSLANRKPE